MDDLQLTFGLERVGTPVAFTMPTHPELSLLSRMGTSDRETCHLHNTHAERNAECDLLLYGEAQPPKYDCRVDCQVKVEESRARYMLSVDSSEPPHCSQHESNVN